jgi:hypothetical protein
VPRRAQDAPPNPELNNILTLLSSIFEAQSALIGALRATRGAARCMGRRPGCAGRACAGMRPPHARRRGLLTFAARRPPAALFGDRLIWIKQSQGDFKVGPAGGPPGCAWGAAAPAPRAARSLPCRQS